MWKSSCGFQQHHLKRKSCYLPDCNNNKLQNMNSQNFGQHCHSHLKRQMYQLAVIPGNPSNPGMLNTTAKQVNGLHGFFCRDLTHVRWFFALLLSSLFTHLLTFSEASTTCFRRMRPKRPQMLLIRPDDFDEQLQSSNTFWHCVYISPQFSISAYSICAFSASYVFTQSGNSPSQITPRDGASPIKLYLQ